MTLDIITVITGQVAEITLSGQLYAGAASDRFQQELERVAASKPSHLVLRARDLEYIASIFLRMLLFIKQPLGSKLTIYVVAPQEQVVDTLNRTGLIQSVVVVDEYPPPN